VVFDLVGGMYLVGASTLDALIAAGFWYNYRRNWHKGRRQAEGMKKAKVALTRKIAPDLR
jgi:hypothetical protein